MNYNAKNRIRQRRYKLLKDELNNECLFENKRNKALSFLSSLCVLLSITLSFLIYAKNDENGSWLKKNFGIELSFSKVNSIMSKYTDYLLDFNIFKKDNDLAVAYVPSYYSLGDNLYESNSNEITSIGDGTVIFVGEYENEKVVIIQHDLGYSATYSGLEDVLVKKYDRVDDKDSIGVSFKSIKIEFEKGFGTLTYEEVVELLSKN